MSDWYTKLQVAYILQISYNYVCIFIAYYFISVYKITKDNYNCPGIP